MAELRVQPRDTPGERAGTAVPVPVDETLAETATQLEEWANGADCWQVELRQGTDFDRANNVEARLVHAGADATSSVTFRLDQVEAVQAFDGELWLTLEERDGLAKAVHLAPRGLDVELFHVVGPPLGGTAA